MLGETETMTMDFRIVVAAWIVIQFTLGAQTPPQFVNVNASTGINLPPSLGVNRGAAWADFDGDGDLDLFAPEGVTAPIQLWVNQGNGTFIPQVVLASGGVSRLDQGCVAADIDNDGDQDVFLCQGGNRRCMLFINDGNGAFTEEAAARGVDWLGFGLAATFGDYDRDGWLDLFVSEWNFGGATHRLFHNDGDGYFTDVSVAAGVDLPGASYAAVFCDVDGDGWQDIFATRDNTGTNVIFRNQGDGTFVDVAPTLGASHQLASMCITVGDLHNDGDWDYFVSNINDHDLLVWDASSQSFQSANGVFWGVAQNYGITGGWAWGGQFFDYDNDGNLDLYYNCIYQFGRLFQGSGSTAPFLEVSAASGVQTALPPSYGLAVVDYDDDGNLDLFSSSGQSGGQLARNLGGGGHWLRVKLEGTICNRDAIGAVVIARTAGVTRRRQLLSGESFLCQGDRRIHFGLGTATTVDSLEIRWPDGSVSVLENLTVDQEISVTQPSFQLVGSLAPGSLNQIHFSPLGDAGRSYGVLLTTKTSPPIALGDGRFLNVWPGDPLANVVVQPGNPFFGPSSGVIPQGGPATVYFNVPNLPGLSGFGSYALAFTLDPFYSPTQIRSIMGPEYLVIP